MTEDDALTATMAATEATTGATTTAKKKKKMTVWDLGEETMAHAMLIFMLPDLRILSSTGQIRTKYEHLCLDSDKSPRHTALDFAGYHDYKETRGVTAAHIMAVLMLEISREASDVEADVSANKAESVLTQELGGALLKRRFIFGRKDIEKASGMPALLHCYNAMVAKDIASDTHQIRKAEFPVMSQVIRDDPVKVTADFNPNVTEDDDSESLFRRRSTLRRAKSLRNLLSPTSPTTAAAAAAVDTESTRTANSSKLKGALHTIAATNKLLMSKAGGGATGDGDCYNQEEVIKLMEQAIETRDRSQIAFMKHFFKEGSISRVLVESKAEMVWLSDWHSAHECTYAISLDTEEKKVLLAFRGAYTFSDWSHAMDIKETATSNPIKENYPNRPKNIRVHGGFHKYLFRVRKDTETTKYDEIAAKVAHYCSMVGEGVTLTITGHSLGAALATVFSLYASTEERFIQNGAIETVTFGAPYVAGYKFADAVRHQEQCGKLRIAKFRVISDGVTSLPPTLISMSKRGAKYFHSGMSITLPGIRKGIFRACGQPKPRIEYNGPTKGFVREYMRQVKDFYFWNIPLRFWVAVKMHTLVEHKERMAIIDVIQEDSVLFRCSLEELYEMRDELKTLSGKNRKK